MHNLIIAVAAEPYSGSLTVICLLLVGTLIGAVENYRKSRVIVGTVCAIAFIFNLYALSVSLIK